jgi:hypothetical protein
LSFLTAPVIVVLTAPVIVILIAPVIVILTAPVIVILTAPVIVIFDRTCHCHFDRTCHCHFDRTCHCHFDPPVVLLLGYGLVEFPRSFFAVGWCSKSPFQIHSHPPPSSDAPATPSRRLRRLHFDAVALSERRDRIKETLSKSLSVLILEPSN